MNNIRLPQLRIKVKSLAEEARMIRREEQRELRFYRNSVPSYKDQHLRNYWSLFRHRKNVVGRVSRESFLVMGFLKFRCREEIEKSYNLNKYGSFKGDSDYFFMGVDIERLHEAIGRFMRTKSNYKKPGLEQVSNWMKKGNVFYDGNKLLDAKFKKFENTDFLKETA